MTTSSASLKHIKLTRVALPTTVIAAFLAITALNGANVKAANRSEVGEVSPLIQMHVGGVHTSLIYKEGAETPKLLIYTRHSEYTGNDLVRRGINDEGVDTGQTFIEDFIVDPNVFPFLTNSALDGGFTFNETIRDSFQDLVYGGFRIFQGLSRSVPTRIAPDLDRELCQVADLSNPDVFMNSGQDFVAFLTEDDSFLNESAFEDAGFSRGLNYNLYCPGHSMLADGRHLAAGGHNLNSQNGYKKINIFDPETEEWEDRPVPAIRAAWEVDRFGVDFFNEDASPFNDITYPLTKPDIDPPHSTDMRYERWYPTAITLPNGDVLIFTGHDRDESVGPMPPNDPDFNATSIIQAVPEYFDVETGTTTALENARKVFPAYSGATVVQTGPGEDDWCVCVIDGNPARPEEASSDPATLRPDDFGGSLDIRFHGGNTGKTYCLDVLGALADPLREEPAENWWTLIDEAQAAHRRGTQADLIFLKGNGETRSHKHVIFGGSSQGVPTAFVELIDYADENPEYQREQDLPSASGAHAATLPDGTVFLAGVGRDYLLYNPNSGNIKTLVTVTETRGGHGVALLLPDATVLITGDNRHSMVPVGDDIFPGGEPDLGVNVARIYQPAYLFDEDGGLAQRPAILEAPDNIEYGETFDIEVSDNGEEIDHVVLLRSSSMTHTLNTDQRYVSLPFDEDGNTLNVKAPKLASQAVPGDYMLFVLTGDGVPSISKHVRLK